MIKYFGLLNFVHFSEIQRLQKEPNQQSIVKIRMTSLKWDYLYKMFRKDDINNDGRLTYEGRIGTMLRFIFSLLGLQLQGIKHTTTQLTCAVYIVRCLLITVALQF